MKGPVFVAFALTFAISVSGQECDLRVLIRDYESRPTEAAVAITDMQGKLLTETISKGGVAEFCDLGIAPFNVVVGLNVCGQVQVKWLSVYQGQTLEVPVYMRPCHGWVPRGCDFLIRLVDEQGTKLAAASLIIQHQVRLTDRFGRIRLSVGRGKELELIARYAGLREEHFSLACGVDDIDSERTIVLKGER